MSTTREEVLAALTDHPEGLTSKELAPMCPACDCDPQVVGRMIAGLRAEGVIHPGSELRDGGTIWIFGRPPAAEAPVERISLPEHSRAAAPQVSEAARAIAAMRQGSTGAPRPKLAAPQSAAPAAPQEGAPMTIRAKIEAVLRMHGPMNSRTMRKHGLKDDTLGQHLGDLATRKLLERLPGGGPRSTIYALPGQTAAEKNGRPPATAPQPTAERAPKGKKAKKAKVRKGPLKADGRGKYKRKQIPPPAPSRPPTINGAPQFAINEEGELGIEHEGGKMRLNSEAFARLRDFIGRTKPVWEGAES